MAIAKGVSLGPYEILDHIGSGGMGEVWRARDQRIGRDVAVKILSESFGAGDDRVRRFEQEARAAGALNHPGLVTIFDVGTNDSSPYIVMELLEGETMRDAIGNDLPTALPRRKAIDYAMQIASALSVAHEKGIIHRDLKPENLFITADGRVKILDFGLAKLAEGPSDSGSHRTGRHLTSAGIVVGTPGYMSPEQVRAQPLDHRTDIFAFGSVLYEMLSGRPAFDCFSAVETMHAVLNSEPPSLATLDPTMPPAINAIVSHCMEKNPRDRFQSARDLAFQLRMLPDVQNTITDVRPVSPSAVATPPRSFRLPYRTAAIAGGLVLAASLAGFALLGMNREAKEGARTFKQLTFGDGVELFPSLAPDGKSIAYVGTESGNRDIYIQRVDGRTAINITSDSPADDSEPAFSPDGGQIAFRSEREGGGIFVMGVTGESVRRLTDAGHNPSWSPDGTLIVFSTAAVEMRPHSRPINGELSIVDTRTGARRLLRDLKFGGPGFGDGSDAVQPNWSPNGKRIAFWSLSGGQREIWTLDPDAPDVKKSVVRAVADSSLNWNPVWSPDGKHLYFGSDRDGTLNLWRIPIDESTGKSLGDPEPLSLPGWINGNFAFSKAGEMVFITVTRSYRVLAIPFDATTGTTGEPRVLIGGTQEIRSFDPSPDGHQIAFTTGGAQEDLFVVNSDGTKMRQLTNDAARDRDVRWSPDGKTLFFHSNRDGKYHIWSIHADGSGLGRVTDAANLKRMESDNIYSPIVSPDGRTLLAWTDGPQAFIHLQRPLAQRVQSLPSGAAEGEDEDLQLGVVRWSPDGQRLVGWKDGKVFIYWPATSRSEFVLPRGTWPQWLPDGNRILFFDGPNLSILDLATRREITTPFKPPKGVHLDFTSVLARDASSLYVRQTVEQGDIWVARFDKNSGSPR